MFGIHILILYVLASGSTLPTMAFYIEEPYIPAGFVQLCCGAVHRTGALHLDTTE